MLFLIYLSSSSIILQRFVEDGWFEFNFDPCVFIWNLFLFELKIECLRLLSILLSTFKIFRPRIPPKPIEFLLLC